MIEIDEASTLHAESWPEVDQVTAYMIRTHEAFTTQLKEAEKHAKGMLTSRVELPSEE